jgi:DNA-binding NtrC family response regulator
MSLPISLSEKRHGARAINMQTPERTFDDSKSNSIIELTKSEVLKTVAYALLRQAYGVAEPQRPNVQQRTNFFDEVRRFEINLIMQALLYSNGRKAEAARLLSLNATTLHSKIKLYSIEMPVETNSAVNHVVAYQGHKERPILHLSEVTSVKRLNSEESTSSDSVTFLSDVETLKTEVIRSIARVLEVKANNHSRVLDFDWKRGVKFYDEVTKFEIELIRQALTQVNSNQRAAARLLSLKTTTFYSKVKLYKLNIDFMAA